MMKLMMYILSNKLNTKTTHTKCKNHSHTKKLNKTIQFKNTKCSKMEIWSTLQKTSSMSSKYKTQVLIVFVVFTKLKLKDHGMIVKKLSFLTPELFVPAQKTNQSQLLMMYQKFMVNMNKPKQQSKMIQFLNKTKLVPQIVPCQIHRLLKEAST